MGASGKGVRRCDLVFEDPPQELPSESLVFGAYPVRYYGIRPAEVGVPTT